MNEYTRIIIAINERLESVGKNPNPDWVTVKTELLRDAQAEIMRLATRLSVYEDVHKGEQYARIECRCEGCRYYQSIPGELGVCKVSTIRRGKHDFCSIGVVRDGNISSGSVPLPLHEKRGGDEDD